ncbi:MAG: protein-glutamate methylesterase/protein-glutamine glutaminase [Acidiferrobacter sp.]
MINVLVVEDSPVIREFLVYILSSDPEIRVIGTAVDGEEALEAAQSQRPDIITMDIHMPRMDGFEATRRIMETCPVPIIIVSGSSVADEVATTFRALEAGALTVLPRPRGVGHAQYEATAKGLIETVKLMAEVKVVKRWARSRVSKAATRAPAQTLTGGAIVPGRIDIVAIGASTGGPQALHAILSRLPRSFPVPILVVQHIAVGFLQGLVDWLAGTCAVSVRIARHGDSALPGQVYVAPDGFHMGVHRGGVIYLTSEEAVNRHQPSVSFLFRSVTNAYGGNAVGVLLTGMGKDGAEELKLMKDNGAVTIAQDAKSSIVHGMPGEAIRLGAATHVLSLDGIVTMLQDLVAHKSGFGRNG